MVLPWFRSFTSLVSWVLVTTTQSSTRHPDQRQTAPAVPPRKTSPSMGDFNCRQGGIIIVVAHASPACPQTLCPRGQAPITFDRNQRGGGKWSSDSKPGNVNSGLRPCCSTASSHCCTASRMTAERDSDICSAIRSRRATISSGSRTGRGIIFGAVERWSGGAVERWSGGAVERWLVTVVPKCFKI